ncbi:APC family permease [Bizionia gelidisalsuginis]|uniref:APC family permease n=1 Tax=Bizionia gelidisalsuginis TaxID=291188 RepID=A0ABY3MBJ5_9FLAO|nr:APC family permease [Bizionia gelidisalsuginis]TYC14165.1 APC family permease [Bizionia gelidisalsuginis]
MKNTKNKNNEKIQLREAIAIGIGGMVGGGIFAVLGLAVSLAKGGTPIAFLIAGVLALFTAYSYSKLSQAFPDKGGTVRFVNEGFGKTIFSGSINNLLWVSYVIMLGLYASAFGSYAPNLLEITGRYSLDTHLYSSAIIILATAINYYSVKVVSKIESYAVVIKLIILIAFIFIGGYGLFENPNVTQLAFSNWETPVNLLTGGMVIFVAYEGFELIANAAPDIKDPKKNISKAYLYSVVFVIVLYIIIAIVTVGSLPFSEIAKAEDYVLAEAAKPLLGKIGFTIITVAALISTFSAINASLYGGSRVSFEIAEDDELPSEFTRQLWNQPIGLFITAILTLILTNTMHLESISTAGSVGFLLIFAIVNYIAFRFSKQIKANKMIPLLGCLFCSIALVTLIFQQFTANKTGVIVSLSVIVMCFLIEYIYKTLERKNIR